MKLNKKGTNRYNTKEEYSIEALANKIKEDFSQSLRVNIRELSLNKKESLKVERQVKRLKKAYQDCALGDKRDKEYVKAHIRMLLLEKMKLTEEELEQYISLNQKSYLINEVKFLILLWVYKREHDSDALKEMILEHHLDKMREDGYYINEDDLNRVFNDVFFNKEYIELDFFTEKVEIIIQLIYQKLYGNGVVDELLYQNLDGVSGGESGIPEWAMDDSVANMLNNTITYSYDSVWIFFQGKKIQLRFLSFGNEKELQRVCRNLYQFDHPGQLSSSKGYIINQMKNGSRITVFRPNLTESWAFIVRKFDNVVAKDINDITQNEKISNILIALVKSCQVIAVTGQQGTGKTTLLKALIGYINQNFPLRVQELEFELWVRKLYPNRNIITFRETDVTKGEEALEVIRKSDGGVTIFGEVVSPVVASWLVSTAHVATRMTMFTHHADSTKTLIHTFRNALLTKGGFSNEIIAAEEVIDAIRFDVHVEVQQDSYGNMRRFVERITEIIPDEKGLYKLNDIVVYDYETASYRFHAISDFTLLSMKKNMQHEDFQKLIEIFENETR